MKRDVKGYVRMVKEQHEKLGMTTSARRGVKAEATAQEESTQAMFNFIKLTLSNKLQVVGSRVIIQGNNAEMQCKLKGAKETGFVRYSFGLSSCRYEDWMGNEFDYSQAWTDFKKKAAEKQEDEKEL